MGLKLTNKIGLNTNPIPSGLGVPSSPIYRVLGLHNSERGLINILAGVALFGGLSLG